MKKSNLNKAVEGLKDKGILTDDQFTEEMRAAFKNILHLEHETDTIQKAVDKMFLGWVSSPLEIEPEERLDMVIYFEAIKNHFKLIAQLKKKMMMG